LISGSFLHDDYVESRLDMKLGSFERIGLSVVVDKFGCSCSWWMG
jgi:hypothetical protein